MTLTRQGKAEVVFFFVSTIDVGVWWLQDGVVHAVCDGGSCNPADRPRFLNANRCTAFLLCGSSSCTYLSSDDYANQRSQNNPQRGSRLKSCEAEEVGNTTEDIADGVRL